MQRAHTGRRRNEATRRAILAAAERLLAMGAPGPLTLPAIAAEAGVGRQTVYRWWSSPGEVLSEALADYAAEQVPVPDTGDPRADLTTFLVATFTSVTGPRNAPALRGLARQAAVDERAAELLRRFTASRRAALRELLERHRAHLAGGADLDLLVDQVYGLLWYRLLLDHAPLDDRTAALVADGLLGPRDA